MQKISRIILAITLAALLSLTGCFSGAPQGEPSPSPSAETDAPAPGAQLEFAIYLYGETHGVEQILERELALWYDFYHQQGMRHLFIELPYYTAEFLNLWMGAEDDSLLNRLYDDWAGTSSQTPVVKTFYQQIKSQCPETVFHGTDVGHQYDTTGARYLAYLEENGQSDSPQYALAQEVIVQGKVFVRETAHPYRENKLAANFIQAYDQLEGEAVMGIYGAAHTDPGGTDFYTGSVPSMAAQLREHYGDLLYTEDISWMARDIEAIRTDTIPVDGTEYAASYYGRAGINRYGTSYTLAVWRLENAYDDLKDRPKTGDVLPYTLYPMLIETGQVFVVDYTATDGSVDRRYYRADGNDLDGAPVTEEFALE